ncbi:zinc ribbon domain-containing protein [Alienimonas chondri]|uniref:Zinc ribbon domain-containing protein n=1 Tax=Alienimonas chondri TaxID=2681879 RepID=A0ABX1V973_9PLAN|nr:zinc ribbon domain-containing protein [Alienimonas chondri]NNJ24657.1 hypothetical protein [Alienimonas chondri]
MSAASTVTCVICQRELEIPPHGAGGTVTCPQCGEANQIAAGDRSNVMAPTCPVCGASVGADDPACGQCGELLGSLTDRAGEGLVQTGGPRSSSTTLGAIVRDSAKDFGRHWLLLCSTALGAQCLWIMLFVTQVFLGIGGILLGAEVLHGALPGDADVLCFFFGYGLGALAALPLNAAVPMGLANLDLAVVRGTLPRGGRSGEGSRFSPLWRPRGRRRMLLCGLIVLGLLAGQLIAWALLVEAWEREFRAVVGSYDALQTLAFAGFAVPTVVMWTLFWPLPFLIVERPDLRHARPLKACLTLPAGRWGGHVAISLVTAVMLFLATLPWTLLLPIVGPMVGLLLAHAYDRGARVAEEAEEPRALDPAGLL